MKKIQISPVLMGTPLTEQELKSIVGGSMALVKSCTCYYTDNNGNETSEAVEADDEDTCSTKCKNNCNNDGACENYSYAYYVSNL